MNDIPTASRKGEIPLYDGIAVSYTDTLSDTAVSGDESHTMQIRYCRAGQAVWERRSGGRIVLNPGDFSLHKTESEIPPRFPAGQYRGITVRIDLRKAAAHPPALIAEVFDELLSETFCRSGTVMFFPGNEQTKSIFEGFYNHPQRLELPYLRIKVLELFLYLMQIKTAEPSRATEYTHEQMDCIREIHDRVLQHMEQRVTIEELSKQYLINPTTLKAAFKAVYGTSLAAHMKEHRMEQAAKLLRETDMSIAEIAAAVGYESQSKFTAAFKNRFAVPPRAYRKRR